MTEAPTQKHRINERLKDYWQSLLKGRAMPLEGEIAMDALKDIWDYCFLVGIQGEKYAYSYMGESLIEAYGDDLTGHEITETLLYPHPDSLLKTFRQVSASAKPGEDDSEFTNSRGLVVKYRSCVLPLAGKDGGPVAYLLGGMKWKAY